MPTLWAAGNLKFAIILSAEYGISALKTSFGFQQHICQEQSILRQISNLGYWRILLSGNSIRLFFNKIVEKFGKLDIDPFAFRINKHLDRYVFWHPEPEAMAINAFFLTWNNNYFYVFSPFSFVGRVLAKIYRDKTNSVMAIPDWSTRYWYPHLLQMTNQNPLYFWPSPRNLTLPHKPSVNHPLLKKLQLIAIRVIILHKIF